MSILRKVPKIEQVLDNMSLESLKRLESLMNSGNGATETYTLFGGENKLNYENKDLGVWYCNIELERNKSVETGFLIWESSTKALFISFDITQCLKEYEIDLTNYSYTKINEKLSIEEFRRVLEDNINKEVVHIDTSGNVEVGKNLVVDGKVILNGKEDLVDTSGNKLISDGGGITTASVNSQTLQLDTSSLTGKDQYVIASMDDGEGNIQYIPLQTYFLDAGYFNKEIKMQNYSRGFSLSLTDISFPSANSYTLNAKNTNVDFTSSLDSSKTWNKKGKVKYIAIEEQNIFTGENTYDYLEISGSGGGSFNLFDNIFSIGVAENINEETFTLTEVGLNKINSMFTNGKLLGLCLEDPANITTKFSFIPFVCFDNGIYWFTVTTYIDGTNLTFSQIRINKTTGAIEMIQKLVAATNAE